MVSASPPDNSSINWNTPTDTDLLTLAQIITKYLQFFDPAVADAVAQDNRKHARQWSASLEAQGIDPRLYLWEGSACCFPGVRRYRGALEKSWCENKQNFPSQTFPDAAELDFNAYPKEICTYLLGDSIQGYSLMHILSHTEITNQVWAEYPVNNYLRGKGIYGLFTSPANTIYVPNSMINTISTNKKLKSLLAERQMRLYRKVCSIVPAGIQLRTDRRERGSEWHIDRFEWSPCFGGNASMRDFLEYRKKRVESMLGRK